ncbi:MAG: amidohydrolase family protein [Anaerolineales bacterium]
MPLTFVNGRIHTPDGPAATLRVRRGHIAALDEKPRRRDRVVDLGGAVVLPGLINAHDHLELNNFPRLKFREWYDNAVDWIADFQPQFETHPQLVAARAVPLPDRLWIGGMKQLLSGVTTVAHHNPLYRQLRRRFPVRVVQRYAWAHSLHIGAGRDGVTLAETYRADRPWIIHAAEGTDDRAAAEIPRLRELGLVQPNSVIVHGVGVLPADRARVSGLVWCPASNDFLFGATAAIRDFPRVALGSDSTLSGSRDLLDELRCAQTTGLATDEELLAMVTGNAARLMQLHGTGRIEVGARADFMVLASGGADPASALLSATRADVQLVVVGGEARLADSRFAHLLRAPGRLCVDSAPRFVPGWICRRLRRLSVDSGFLGWVASE